MADYISPLTVLSSYTEPDFLNLSSLFGLNSPQTPTQAPTSTPTPTRGPVVPTTVTPINPFGTESDKDKPVTTQKTPVSNSTKTTPPVTTTPAQTTQAQTPSNQGTTNVFACVVS